MASNFEGTYKNLRPPALIIAGCSVFVALVLSILLILQHLRSYTNPAEQKWIVAVISMVPIYATESIISLWNPRLSLACDILRNCYEAFALYSFGRYLIACLGGEGKVVELLEDESAEQLSESLLNGSDENHGEERNRPFCNFFWRPSKIGKDLLTIEKFGLVQYMILKTVCALLAFILELAGVYGDGEFKWYYGYPYIAVVLNFSQMWALYCLVQFYHVTHERLQPINPLAKFISFKAIVFATWWQGLGIAVLCTFGVLPNEGKFQTALQDFLISIEMAIAAVAHVFVFSAKPYHFLPPSACGKVSKKTTEAALEIDDGNKQKSAVLKETTTQVEAPTTSVTESVQDIVVEGGQRVVKDVALTINQAIGPVEKGVTRIQQTLHHKTVVSSDDEEVEDEEDIQVEKDVSTS